MVWYHLFFDIEDGELQRAQSFEDEWKTSKFGQRVNRNQIVRFMIASIIVSLFKNSIRINPWQNLFVYFTNWSQWCILLTALLGFILASKPHYDQERALNIHALHHLFYTLSMFTQPVVILIYWGVVHQSNVKEIRLEANGNQALFEDMLIHSVLVHILPGLCCLALLLINQTVLIKRHSSYLIAFGIFYAISNYYTVKQRG